jgi:hypothetical protein
VVHERKRLAGFWLCASPSLCPFAVAHAQMCVLVNDLTLSRNAVCDVCAAVCEEFDLDFALA